MNMKKTLRRMYIILRETDKALLIFSLLYAIIGIIFILDASSINAKLNPNINNAYYFFNKQILSLVAAIILSLFILVFVSSKHYHNIGLYGTGLLCLIMLGKLVKGHTFQSGNFDFAIPIGLGRSIQPAEFIKLLLILFVATYYHYYFINESKGKKINWIIIIAPIIACTIPIAFVSLKDFGSGAVMALIVAIMFLFVPTKNKIFINFKIIGGTILVISILFLLFAHKIFDVGSSSYHQLRRLDYTRPCDKYYTSGYQVCNSYIAIDNGGLFRFGLGKSTQKYLYLPEPHTDFIFPIIVEEVGVVPASILILGYLIIIYRLIVICKSCNNLRDSLICFGVCIYFILHIVINLGGVLALVPLTGIPLPLLSYGGSSLLSIFCSFAIVQRICVENKIKQRRRDIKQIVNI